ncbi:hypothetical protein [Actinoplanes sp. NPDC026623]|uniref:WXG100 family type VII secretion target n=1 Tax=Actinoplanes sp. NPDC026623 TaxID=3155610 RepID=UPI00340298F6
MSDGVFVPGGGTPWAAYNTPRIWAMVEGEDNPESWRQVAALGAMAGLLKDQRSRLESAKESLAEAWPPEQSPAASAFVGLIDDLLFNMQKNKDVADANAGALGQILEELRQAKADIAPLYEAYLQKKDDWVPAWWDDAEDELDDAARERMRRAEVVIAHPDNAITAPPAYELKPDFTRTKIDNEGDPRNRSNSSGQSGLNGRGSAAAGNDVDVPHDPPPPLPGQDPSGFGGATPSGPSGPGLAEVASPPPGLPGNPLAPVPSPPSGLPPSPSGGGLVIGGGTPFGPPIPGPGPGGGRVPFGQRVGGAALGRGGVSAGKPVTPSWLPPASGQPTRGGSSAGRPGATRPGAGRPGTTSPLMGSSAAPMTGGRHSGGKRGDAAPFDPDNPWVTAEGVDPVIEPSRQEHRHDPGPGVIGWHE